MKLRLVTTALLAAIALFTLTGCDGRNVMESRREAEQVISRATAEANTANLQQRIINAFPATATNDTPDRNWTLLSCSANDVQSATGARLVVPERIRTTETFEAITRDVEPDGYMIETGSSRKGDPKLIVTGRADDQYFITVINDSGRVVINSFSQCFPGSLTDD